MERKREPWLAAFVICSGFFMIMLDTTIVLVALPAVVGSLGASLDAALWVVNAYLLVYAVLLITTGRLGDVLGSERCSRRDSSSSRSPRCCAGCRPTPAS
jgi:MFS family permease